jgi:hypothetical protein
MTLFELLKKGCTIVYPSGYILEGDPDYGYINTKIELAGEYHSDGVRDLTKEGVRLAQQDEKKYAENNGPG